MDRRDRKFAVDTACADLQAQLEASERTLRHIDNDVLAIDNSVANTLRRGNAVGQLVRHAREMREHLREQRNALRMLHRETTALCRTLREGWHDEATSIERQRIEADHDQLLVDHEQMKQNPHDMEGHAEHKVRLRKHLTDLHELRDKKKILPG